MNKKQEIKKKKTFQVHFEVSEKTYGEISRMSERHGVSMAHLMRMAWARYYRRLSTHGIDG